MEDIQVYYVLLNGLWGKHTHNLIRTMIKGLGQNCFCADSAQYKNHN